MNKQEWIKRQVAFLFAHEETGISVKSWCQKLQLNYSTARRYIKVRRFKKYMRLEQSPLLKSNARGSIKKRGAPLGSQNALKHGGYSKFFYNDYEQEVEAITEEDELRLCRSRIHHALTEALLIYDELEKKHPVDIAIKLYDSFFLADQAIDRNLSRIEQITRKKSKKRLEDK
jgi:uncharacterized protein YjcR